VSEPRPRPLSVALEAGAPLDELWWILSQDAEPTTSLGAVRASFDAMGAMLCDAMEERTSVGAISDAQLLVSLVHSELGFRGNQDAYHDPRNSLVSEVLERRLGIPITLALVLVEVGRRAGMRVRGVGFPGHFLVKVERDGAEVMVDPFAGTILTRATLERLALRTTGAAKVTDDQLAPSDTRSIVVRMLRNLKHAYELRGEHARAHLTTDRLLELTSSIELRRDRGLHALALGAGRSAIEDLEAYLVAVPDAPDGHLVRRALTKARTERASVLQ
jgi:regulator of sirC expression with transglutaminase-like and TPR domain